MGYCKEQIISLLQGILQDIKGSKYKRISTLCGYSKTKSTELGENGFSEEDKNSFVKHQVLFIKKECEDILNEKERLDTPEKIKEVVTQLQRTFATIERLYPDYSASTSSLCKLIKKIKDRLNQLIETPKQIPKLSLIELEIDFKSTQQCNINGFFTAVDNVIIKLPGYSAKISREFFEGQIKPLLETYEGSCILTSIYLTENQANQLKQLIDNYQGDQQTINEEVQREALQY